MHLTVLVVQIHPHKFWDSESLHLYDSQLQGKKDKHHKQLFGRYHNLANAPL
jgi:hypothetical protein